MFVSVPCANGKWEPLSLSDSKTATKCSQQLRYTKTVSRVVTWHVVYSYSAINVTRSHTIVNRMQTLTFYGIPDDYYYNILYDIILIKCK